MHIEYTLRPIVREDNVKIASVIRSVLREFKADQGGTAFDDPSLDSMFETYQADGAIYYIVEANHSPAGGCGVFPLEGKWDGICEIQKMYILPQFRGIGMGRQLLDSCEEFARTCGYKGCYIETLPGMHTAINLYRSRGYEISPRRMGETGHYSCDIWLYKQLQ